MTSLCQISRSCHLNINAPEKIKPLSLYTSVIRERGKTGEARLRRGKPKE